MSPHLSLTISTILFIASVFVNIKTMILTWRIKKILKQQNKLDNLQKKMDIQEEALKKMDIKSNYILSLTHVENNIYTLKTEDDKEYLCRKLNGGDSSVSHYIIEGASKEDMERIHKVKHVSVGFSAEHIKDSDFKYSYTCGKTDKNLPSIQLPDSVKIDMDKIK